MTEFKKSFVKYINPFSKVVSKLERHWKYHPSGHRCLDHVYSRLLTPKLEHKRKKIYQRQQHYSMSKQLSAKSSAHQLSLPHDPDTHINFRAKWGRAACERASFNAVVAAIITRSCLCEGKVLVHEQAMM